MTDNGTEPEHDDPTLEKVEIRLLGTSALTFYSADDARSDA